MVIEWLWKTFFYWRYILIKSIFMSLLKNMISKCLSYKECVKMVFPFSFSIKLNILYPIKLLFRFIFIIKEKVKKNVIEREKVKNYHTSCLISFIENKWHLSVFIWKMHMEANKFYIIYVWLGLQNYPLLFISFKYREMTRKSGIHKSCIPFCLSFLHFFFFFAPSTFSVFANIKMLKWMG